LTAIYVGSALVAFTFALVIVLALALALALAFVLALTRTASHAEETSEHLLVECAREQARVLETLASTTIEARRMRASEVATQLSHRRTWRQPSSA
jgi:hypothetical protein